MKIAFIGSGNIATFFSWKIHEAGHEIVQVVSSTLSHAEELASKYQCTFSNSIKDITADADVYIFAVNDDSLHAFNNTLRLTGKTVIHTAGSMSLNEIENISEHCGSIWCMQSVHKEALPQNKDIPTFINYNSDKAKNAVELLANCISEKVTFCNDEKKLTLHLAAVLANNFTNHLYTIVEKLFAQQQLPFELILPIIEHTTEQLHTSSPSETQTGPAIRGDNKVIEKHLQLLSEHQEWKKIYEAMTNSIKN